MEIIANPDNAGDGAHDLEHQLRRVFELLKDILAHHRLVIVEYVIHAPLLELPVFRIPPLGGLDDARDGVNADHLLKREAAQLLEPVEQVTVGQTKQLNRELLGHAHCHNGDAIGRRG